MNVSGDDIAAEPLLEEGVELEIDEATVVLEPFGVAVLGVTRSPLAGVGPGRPGGGPVRIAHAID